MRSIGIGIIGTGFMGKAHAFAYRAVAGIFPGSLRPVLKCVADIDGPAAERAAGQLGFSRWSADWRSLVEDPDRVIGAIEAMLVDFRQDPRVKVHLLEGPRILGIEDVSTGQFIFAEINLDEPTPRPMPINPPTVLRVRASIRNCSRIS